MRHITLIFFFKVSCFCQCHFHTTQMTTLLTDLHWLPAAACIQFKALVQAFKAKVMTLLCSGTSVVE